MGQTARKHPRQISAQSSPMAINPPPLIHPNRIQLQSLHLCRTFFPTVAHSLSFSHPVSMVLLAVQTIPLNKGSPCPHHCPRR